MKSQKRIYAIFNAVAFASLKFKRKIVVADIGTDHGFVAKLLSESNFAEKVIATDISEKSLSKLEKLIENHNLKNIETRVGNGLEPIEKADVTVIAGMGGFEIIKMLEFQNITVEEEKQNFSAEQMMKKNIDVYSKKTQFFRKKVKKKCNIFVLQPAQNIVELRFWVMKNHYKILKDVTVKDGDIFYPILVVDVSKFAISRKSVYNLWIGRDSKENVVDFNKYMIYLNDYLSFLNGVTKKRLTEDKILYQKYKLKKIIKKYLK